MVDQIRHLRGLQAFDAAASCANLSRAAEQLGVSHGAVSRQIKQLETYLGVPLLHRRANGVEKTQAGERLHQATRQALSALADGIRDVRLGDNQSSITISLSSSLAIKWLVPLLGSFRAAHPGLSVFLDTNDEVIDLRAGQVDVALRYGVPDWGDLYCERLTREELVVVAAPKLVEGRAVPMHPQEILELPLLHDAYNPAWDRWAIACGFDPLATEPAELRFADTAVLVAAAIDGQGVALARRLLVRADLDAGRLVRLDNSVTALDHALYFVCRPGDQEKLPIRQFRNWVVSLLLQDE